jgi:hypothetical protein
MASNGSKTTKTKKLHSAPRSTRAVGVRALQGVSLSSVAAQPLFLYGVDPAAVRLWQNGCKLFDLAHRN